MPEHCGPEKNIHFDIPIAQLTGKMAALSNPTPRIRFRNFLTCLLGVRFHFFSEQLDNAIRDIQHLAIRTIEHG